MADTKGSSETSAEKAYAAAAAEVKDAPVPAEKAAAPAAKAPSAEPKPAESVADKSSPASKASPASKSAVKNVKKASPAKKSPARKPATKKVARKAASSTKPKAGPAAKPTPARQAPVKKPAPVAARAAQAAPKPKAPSVTDLKEMIMATKTVDFTETLSKSMTEAVSDMQTKAQAAYDKGTAMVADMTELAKGNVEALVESSKILAGGVQDMGKSYADEAKSVYETATTDMKEMAAVKSPTELFQLQGKILRRNFDAMVATSSKNTEAAMKLANDVFAPLSSRVNVTVEKISAVA